MAEIDKEEERFFTILFKVSGGWHIHRAIKPVKTLKEVYNIFKLLVLTGSDDILRIGTCDAQKDNSDLLGLDQLLQIQKEEGWTFAP